MSFFSNLKKSTNTDKREPNVERRDAISESQKKNRFIMDGEWIKNVAPSDAGPNSTQPENVNYGRAVLGGFQTRLSPPGKVSGTDKNKSATLDRLESRIQLIDTRNKVTLNRYQSEEFLFREKITADTPSKPRQSTTLDRPKTDTSSMDSYRTPTVDKKSKPFRGSTEKLSSSTSQPSSTAVKTPTSETSPSKPFWGSTEKLSSGNNQPSPTTGKTPIRDTSSTDTYKSSTLERKSKPFWGSTEQLSSSTTQPSPTIGKTPIGYRAPSVKVEESAKPVIIKGILPKDETPASPRNSWTSKDSSSTKKPAVETQYLIDLSPNKEETRNGSPASSVIIGNLNDLKNTPQKIRKSSEDLDKINPFTSTQTKHDPYSKDLMDDSDKEDNSENISPYPTTTTKTTYDPKSSRINGGKENTSFTKQSYEPEIRNSSSSLRSDPPNNLQTRIITTSFSVAEKTAKDPNACTYCFKSIALSPRIIIEDMNLNTHASCFKCQICNESLEDIQAGQSVWIHRQMIHCEPCYDNMRAKLTYA